MDSKIEHQMLLNQYHSFQAILQQRGLSYEGPTDDEVAKMNDADLGRLTRSLRDLARTPGIDR